MRESARDGPGVGAAEHALQIAGPGGPAAQLGGHLGVVGGAGDVAEDAISLKESPWTTSIHNPFAGSIKRA